MFFGLVQLIFLYYCIHKPFQTTWVNSAPQAHHNYRTCFLVDEKRRRCLKRTLHHWNKKEWTLKTWPDVKELTLKHFIFKNHDVVSCTVNWSKCPTLKERNVINATMWSSVPPQQLFWLLHGYFFLQSVQLKRYSSFQHTGFLKHCYI